jgi:acetoin utilization protein AcuB
MRVGEIMRTRVATISPGEPVDVALRRMRQARIRHLVVQDGTAIVGVLSDRDIPPAGSKRQVPAVEDVMSRQAVTCSPETTLRRAANVLRDRKIDSLPVVEGGKLVGILTTTDLLEVIDAEIETPVKKTRRRVLKERGPHHKLVSGRGRTVRLPAPRPAP